MTSQEVCTRCIMDTTDPDIYFDANGVCNHCHDFEKIQKPQIKTGEEGETLLKSYVSAIKQRGKGQRYDCIIGLSGGVDSSYVAYKVIELGLKPLAIHVDTGWNSETSVRNIEKIINNLKIDLYTHVINWQDMQDLQLSFLKAGVANCDVPQDHSFVAVLYYIAIKHNIRTIISGHNLSSESILPEAWGYTSIDRRHLRSIHNRYGERQLKDYPSYSLFEYTFWWPYIKKLKIFPILNYMEYNKEEVKRWLMKESGWLDYGGKHYESRFTKFFQSYYLPHKFNYDKRKAHLSSLIVSGQITREQALQDLNKPLYGAEELEDDKAFIAKKLGITSQELDNIIDGPNRTYKDFPSNANLVENLLKLKSWIRNKRRAI